MQSRSRPARHRRHAIVAALLAALPMPVLAAERALGAWGPYLFFAIAVTLVIVLLLHEVLEDDASNERRRDRNTRYSNPRGERR